MVRKKEYFTDSAYDYGKALGTVMSTIKSTFPQERDWTCSLACLRTLMSAHNMLLDEDNLIESLGLTPGPINSKDIKSWNILSEFNALYGCVDTMQSKVARDLTVLLTEYNIMVECMLNHAHWIVILGYVDLGDVEKDTIIYYDPYYDRVNTIIADEFFSMWYDVSDEPIHRDYVAIPKHPLSK